MLPILIEEDTQDLPGVICRKIKGWLGEDIDAEFLAALMQTQRRLGVVDRLSERTEETREYIRRIHGIASVGALMVTTRDAVDFEGGDELMLSTQPVRPEGWTFFITYLLQLEPDPKPFPTPEQQIELAGRFARMVGNDPVTPLLLKLYIKKAVQLGSGVSLDGLPTSIPNVYFQYLSAVNPTDRAADNFMPNDEMLRAAEQLGGLAIEDGFVPREFLKSRARVELNRNELQGNGQVDAIKRLIDNGILQEEPFGTDFQLRFTLDPIAEVLG